MGLDMYLDKAKRIDGATANDIYTIENYFDWKLRPSKYEKSSMKQWCGRNQSDVNKELADEYLYEYKTRYYVWDDEKQYGHLGLWDGVAYWRKANAIHNWFVENVQNGVDDCGVYEVTKEDLEELLYACKTVKSHSKLVNGKIKNGQMLNNEKWEWEDVIEDGKYIEDPSVAMELLPVTSGFFFGSTEYDQWYMDNIVYTIDVLTKLLRETDFDHEIVAYTSSW